MFLCGFSDAVRDRFELNSSTQGGIQENPAKKQKLLNQTPSFDLSLDSEDDEEQPEK